MGGLVQTGNPLLTGQEPTGSLAAALTLAHPPWQLGLALARAWALESEEPGGEVPGSP